MLGFWEVLTCTTITWNSPELHQHRYSNVLRIIDEARPNDWMFMSVSNTFQCWIIRFLSVNMIHKWCRFNHTYLLRQVTLWMKWLIINSITSGLKIEIKCCYNIRFCNQVVKGIDWAHCGIILRIEYLFRFLFLWNLLSY